MVSIADVDVVNVGVAEVVGIQTAQLCRIRRFFIRLKRRQDEIFHVFIFKVVASHHTHTHTVFRAASEGNDTYLQHCLQMDRYTIAEGDDTFDRTTALLCACEEGHIELAEKLITVHKADVHASDSYRKTALHCACAGGHTELAQKLITVHGANYLKLTVLHLACVGGHTELAEMLITVHGANVHAKNSNKSTALHLACMGGHIELAEKLITVHGANVTALDKLGLTPLDYARTGGHAKLAERLIAVHGATSHNEFSVDKRATTQVTGLTVHDRYTVT